VTFLFVTPKIFIFSPKTGLVTPKTAFSGQKWGIVTKNDTKNRIFRALFGGGYPKNRVFSLKTTIIFNSISQTSHDCKHITSVVLICPIFFYAKKPGF